MKRLYENAIYYDADVDVDVDMDSLMAFLSYHEKNMLSLQKMMPKVFECKTCNRRFPSFQALGGHRASHKKPRMADDGSLLKPKLHECSICGLEFAVGQALGGHMRRHRSLAHGVVVKKQEGEKKLFCFDLNEPASSDEEETTDSGIAGHDHQFDSTDTSPIAVDCIL